MPRSDGQPTGPTSPTQPGERPDGSDDRIVLLGMMGAGKTTIGALLSERLGWPYLDNDEAVRAMTGREPAEIGDTVVMSDAPLEKTAVGEFVVVHMTVTNVGTDPASFIGMFQTLHAGGTTYPLDDEATAYLEGTFADLEPGQSADVSVAYDVPVGTPPESIELHADPSTPGAEVPLA